MCVYVCWHSIRNKGFELCVICRHDTVHSLSTCWLSKHDDSRHCDAVDHFAHFYELTMICSLCGRYVFACICGVKETAILQWVYSRWHSAIYAGHIFYLFLHFINTFAAICQTIVWNKCFSSNRWYCFQSQNISQKECFH